MLDTDKNCCIATFTNPNSDPVDLPPLSYLICPIGSEQTNVEFKSSWADSDYDSAYCDYTVSSSPQEYCETWIPTLGNCPDLPDKPKEKVCTNPNQYNNSDDCKAAGCIWFTDQATGGQRCIAP